MTSTRPIRNTAELIAHAAEMEREAAARYTELAQSMRDLGNEAVAELFLRLAEIERRHEQDLNAYARGLQAPAPARSEHAWFEDDAPETAAQGLVPNLLTPHGALQIALDAEKRALAFFESVRAQTTNPQLAALATEMAAEEGVHVEWVKSALRRTQDPAVDFAATFG